MAEEVDWDGRLQGWWFNPRLLQSTYGGVSLSKTLNPKLVSMAVPVPYVVACHHHECVCMSVCVNG